MTHQTDEVIIHRFDDSKLKLSVPYDPYNIEKTATKTQGASGGEMMLCGKCVR